MGQPWVAHVTVAQYDQLPEDGRRYEVFDGDLMMSPGPDLAHQRASWNLTALFVMWLHSCPAGDRGQFFTAPTDVILADDCIVQPDLLYVSPARAKLLLRERVYGAPDLVVEIFHQRGAERDRVSKLSLYARFGVKEYWLVDLDNRTVSILANQDGVYRTLASGAGDQPLTSTVLAGFTIRPADVFEGIG